MADSLTVFYELRTVGHITLHEDGPCFEYDPEWLRTRGAFPISLLMPLGPRRVPPNIFYPWATNLLPEAKQLTAIGRQLGASPQDVIAILSEIGRDTAGALSVGQRGSSKPSQWRPVKGAKELERILDELPKKPFLVGDEGVSMSLAGVQAKIGVALDERGRIAIPIEGAPSTHILKPDAAELFGSVQNEAYCLTLAKLCGVNVPDITTGVAGKRSYLLVTRYDRHQQGDGWRRLHQEDFCQALGKPPSAKYESNQSGIKGPTLADMFAITRNTMRPTDTLALLDYAIFNILACNTDAHAKNYSLMISAQGMRMAPLYDVMCAEVFDNVTRNLAQKIAGKNRGEHLKARHWKKFAEEVGLNPRQTLARIKALAELVSLKLDDAVEAVEAMPAGSHPMLKHIRSAIHRRAKAVLSGLEDKSDGKPQAIDPATKKVARTRRPAKAAPRAR
jgi:serine/threonine-protein kinase HipA